MNLKTCLDIGIECGLSSVSDCIQNIEVHSSMFFKYSETNRELQELYDELDNYAINISLVELYEKLA